MIGDKVVLAVVPARGGSKGIPLKNLHPVNGTPMVAMVGECLARVPEIDRAVVSTDHEEIARVAENSGISAPFRRPESLSGDRIGDLDVLTHALLETEKIDGRRFDIVVMLQPTSPLRLPTHVSETIRMLRKGGYDSVWTVSETDSKGHPLKQLTVTGGHLAMYDPSGGSIVARQQLSPVYHRNGIAYAMTRECLINQKTILGANAGALILDGHFVSIDTPWDIELVEFLMSRRDRSQNGGAS